MNEDVLNMEIRKFLKKVGITSQREIEKEIYKAEKAGRGSNTSGTLWFRCKTQGSF